jgi:hypothetical protein
MTIEELADRLLDVLGNCDVKFAWSNRTAVHRVLIAELEAIGVRVPREPGPNEVEVRVPVWFRPDGRWVSVAMQQIDGEIRDGSRLAADIHNKCHIIRAIIQRPKLTEPPVIDGEVVDNAEFREAVQAVREVRDE